MLKFIHAADIHLDSLLRGLSRYGSAPVDAIRDASRRAFKNLAAGFCQGLKGCVVLTVEDSDQIDGMDDKIAELRQKVPLEAFGTGSMLDVNDKQALERITREAKKMLIGRLLADTSNDTGKIFQHALS